MAYARVTSISADINSIFLTMYFKPQLQIYLWGLLANDVQRNSVFNLNCSKLRIFYEVSQRGCGS